MWNFLKYSHTVFCGMEIEREESTFIFLFYFPILFFYCYVGWGCIIAFIKVLKIYHTWIHLHHSPLSPLSHIPGIVSTGIIFTFTYMCTQYLYRTHPCSPFPHLLPSLTGTNPPRQDLYHPPSLHFVKEKNWHFCLFKIATQGVSLWHFHVCMYYSLVHILYFS
jgi:hypothetical protein